MLFAFLSVFFVIEAPGEYSYGYCLQIALLYIVQNVIFFILRRDKNLVSFEFFFFIAFGLTNFVYPLAYFRTNPEFSMFSLPFNTSIITKATSIAFSAYSLYFVGVSIYDRKFNGFIAPLFERIDLKSKIVYRISLLSLFLYIISGGASAMSEIYSGDSDSVNLGLSPYFYFILFSTTLILCVMVFNESLESKMRFYIFSYLAFLASLFIVLGSRTLPLAIGISLFVAYNNFRRKIPLLVFFVMIFLGVVLMTFIMFARSISITDANYASKAAESVELNSLWDLGSDLIINNRNLYTLIDFADTHGYTYGLSMLGGLFSPIPFLQGFFCSSFSIPPDFINSATFNTFLDLGEGSTWGLGTNLVSDVYLAFGYIPLLFFFLGFGCILGKSKLHSNNNFYWQVIFYLLISNSVYWVRSGFFDNLRTVIWSVLIVYFVERYVVFKSKFCL